MFFILIKYIMTLINVISKYVSRINFECLITCNVISYANLFSLYCALYSKTVDSTNAKSMQYTTINIPEKYLRYFNFFSFVDRLLVYQ